MQRTLAALALLLAAGCQSPAPVAELTGTKIIYLRHVAADDVVSTLRQMGTPAALTATPHAASNSIALQGESGVVAQAVTLITAIDKPAR